MRWGASHVTGTQYLDFTVYDHDIGVNTPMQYQYIQYPNTTSRATGKPCESDSGFVPRVLRYFFTPFGRLVHLERRTGTAPA